MPVCVTALPDGKVISAEKGENLLCVLRRGNLAPDAPCGGNGKCGKCIVYIENQPVASCQYLVTRDVTVRLKKEVDNTRILVDGIGANVTPNPLRDGPLAAIDIGTTTVVCYILNDRGELLSASSAINPQQSFGADVISRIQCALSGQMKALTELIRGTVEKILIDACNKAHIQAGDIGVISVVGNPCMQQLFLGILPDNLARIPFSPVLKEITVQNAADFVPVCANASMITVPDISGYVGADTIGCVLATEIDRSSTISLIVDIGTNGEMVLGSSNGMIACATAAGPALEGARIRFGMRGTDGAIDHVFVKDGSFSVHVIGNVPARGICGSGLIDAIAVLLEQGLINERGRLSERKENLPLSECLGEAEGQRIFSLTDDIYITQDDIRQVQMAKGAIAAGIDLMTARLGIAVADIEQILLAGAFGTYIRPESACRIGLLPAALLNRIKSIGNAAGSGAQRVACSKSEMEKAEILAKKIEFIELAADPNFQRTFARNMRFCL